MTVKAPEINARRHQPMSNTKLLMLIAIGIFVVMYAAAMLLIGKRFLNLQEIFNLLNNNAYLIILGCALTIVMIGGGIDISVGGVVCLTAMSVAKFLQTSGIEGVPGVLLSMLLALGIGLLFGLEQGFLVSYLGIQPFIVTLAGMFLSRGITTMISSENVPIKHEAFLEMKKVAIQIPGVFKLEIGAAFALIILLLMYLLLRHHKLGRSIYALGGNQQSALMLGINVKKTRFMAYILCGLLSGISGYVFMMHTGAGNATNAAGMEMNAIAASIIGGTFFGTMTLTTIKKIVVSSGLNDPWWQSITTGGMLCFFILLQSVVLSRRSKKKE